MKKRRETPSSFDDIDILANNYKRHGGKKNRSEQVAKIRRVFNHAKTKYGTRSIYEMGSRQITSFWRENEGLSDQTLYAYWLALKQLYKWMGRQGEPPKPRKKTLPVDTEFKE